MSWFLYGTPKRRSLRKGVWLRRRCLPDSILEDIKPLMRQGDQLQWVEVCEIRPEGQVLLEFWCQSLEDIPFNRYTVFHIVTKEDPEWVCEGDLGRGFKAEKKQDNEEQAQTQENP